MMWRVSVHEQLVRETWEALERGDFGAVEAVLAPDARWRAVEDGPWNCEGRARVIEVMRENRAQQMLAGDVEQVLDAEHGRVIVAFRPVSEPRGSPLDEGVRWVVLSLDGEGLVSEMKGCADRATAVAYAGSA
jgi:ketosteroid isomerase-like protein